MSVAAVVPGPAGGDLGEQGGAARRHPLLRRQRAHGEKMMITLNGGGARRDCRQKPRETRSLHRILSCAMYRYVKKLKDRLRVSYNAGSRNLSFFDISVLVIVSNLG